jgi:hypothetical protein
MFRKPTSGTSHELFAKLLSEKYRAVVPISVPHVGVIHNYKGKPERPKQPTPPTGWVPYGLALARIRRTTRA